jgi:hypothetical protein
MYAYNSGDDLLHSSDGTKKRRTSGSGADDDWADDLDSEFFEVRGSICLMIYFSALT